MSTKYLEVVVDIVKKNKSVYHIANFHLDDSMKAQPSARKNNLLQDAIAVTCTGTSPGHQSSSIPGQSWHPKALDLAETRLTLQRFARHCATDAILIEVA